VREKSAPPDAVLDHRSGPCDYGVMNRVIRWALLIIIPAFFTVSRSKAADSEIDSIAKTEIRVRRSISTGATNWAVTLEEKFSVAVGRGRVTDTNSETVLSMFKRESLEAVKGMFKKFVDWEKTARDNNVEEFRREIATIDGRKFTFEWRAWRSRVPEAKLIDDSAVPSSGVRLLPGRAWQMGYYFTIEDANHLLALLEKMPEMEREYEERARNAKKQSDLFK
jgi:hypothetical protein